MLGAHRLLQVEASARRGSVEVFSLDDKGRRREKEEDGGKKCARPLPPRCDVAPGEAKSSLSLREGERKRRQLVFEEDPAESGEGVNTHTHTHTHTEVVEEERPDLQCFLGWT